MHLCQIQNALQGILHSISLPAAEGPGNDGELTFWDHALLMQTVSEEVTKQTSIQVSSIENAGTAKIEFDALCGLSMGRHPI